MMSSTVSNKRTRLSEPEQTQNQQFTNNHAQLRPMFHKSSNQHQHQLIPGEFIQSSQVQQQQQQQITPPQQESESPLTKQDIQRLQKGFDFLIETIVPNKSKQAKDVFTSILKTSLSSNLSLQNNDSIPKSNSIVLDIPILTDSTQESEKVVSPLSQLLNHTFPSSIVELVDKLSKISINPLNSTLPNHNNNSTNKISSPSTSTPSPKTPLPPPSRELCQQLIQEYFTQFNPTLPILDRRKFIDHWRSENTKHSQLLVTATLALAAARYSDDPSIQKTPDKPGGVFFDSAKKLLDTMYDTPRLETVQALLLLSHAENNISRVDSAFMFLGMAVRMAHILHLERDDSSNLLPEEDEERRRVFYCIYCCDRWCSLMLGNPYVIDDINVNVQLPTLPSFEKPARNFFIAFIKLSRIIGQIWKFGYSSQPKAIQSTWTDHVTDQKSMLRQIRSALAKWLKELPDELQYQYLPNTDIRSLFQLARFSVYAGHINIMFHVCIILLHQPYLTQAYDNPKIESSQGPIKTCLTAATTIIDIAKTTRHFDKKAFCNFHYPIYGLVQSALIEIVIMNGSADHAQDAKKALNDSIVELRWVGDNANIGSLKEIVKELEAIMMITNGSSDGNHFSIPLPLVIQMLEQNNNNLQNTQKSSSITTCNNDNNTTSNSSTRSQYTDDNFNSTDSTKAEFSSSNSNGDNSTTISNSEPTLNGLRQSLTNTTNKNLNTHLQNQSQQQSVQQRTQLQDQQITHPQITQQPQSNMFIIPQTSASLFDTPQDHATSTSVVNNSLHQQFHNISSSFDADDNHHPQDYPFYMEDSDFLFDNTTNAGDTAANQVIDDLSSLYSGFNTFPEATHNGSVS